jgi:hypothetical protein
VRIAEVDLHVGVRAEANVIGHLLALIPGQSPAQLRRHLGNLARQRRAHILGGPSVRQVKKYDIAAGPLHQRADRRATTFSDDEIALPVPWNSAICDFRRAITDQDHVPEPALAGVFNPHMWTSLRPSCPQAGCELFPQRSTGLDE